jgi:hypothetical protein
VAAIFSKRHLYMVDAWHTGDGCGFQGNNEYAERARQELADFLDDVLELAPECELFVRQINLTARAVSPASYDKIGPNDIRTWRTTFKDDEFLSIVRDAE